MPTAARLAVLALVYFIAAKASLVFAIPPGYATAVWPPSGIAVAAIILWGTRCWPGIWLGAALANFTIGLSVPAALGIATGNTLEALCAGWLAARLVDRSPGFRRPEAVFQFAVSAAAASVIGASTGAAALWLIDAVPDAAFLANWYTWWQGDATGILVVTPCVLAWARAARSAEPPLHASELTLFSALFLAALLGVFAQNPAHEFLRPIAFLTMPFFAWAACRYDERVVTSSVLFGAGFAIWCTVNARGPFFGASLNESLLTLQAFVSTAALIALALRALMRERAVAMRSLRVSHDALDETVRVQDVALDARNDVLAKAQALAHVGLWSWDSRSGRMLWSDELCRIYGLQAGNFEGSLEAYLARVDPRDRERMRSLLHGALFESRPWEVMERIVRSDGAVRVLHSFGYAAPRARGEPARIQGYCVDVTERVRLEQVQSALHEIGLVLARAPGVEQAVPAALRILCQKLDWEAALYWRVEEPLACLRSHAVYPADRPSLGLQLGANQRAAPPMRAWREQRAVWSSAAGAFALPVTAGGTVLGVIELRGGAIFEPETELLEMAISLGALLGEYIVRTRNDQSVRESEARLRDLSRRMLDAEESERRRIATQLRDAVARPLAAAHANPASARLAVRLAAPLAAVRELIAQLRPSALEDYGLLAALRTYAARFERRTGIAVAVVGADDAAAVDARLESALFQIARDALDNVARHSRARSAAVQFDVSGGMATLSIRDDGAGFDAQAPLPAAGWGLTLMRERAEAIGGRLRVESKPGRGSEVSVRVRG